MNKQALVIKAELIDALLTQKNLDLLISELPFLKCNRLADLIAIDKDTTIGFEIKSDKDSLRYLQKQISDYLKVFNITYIVIAEKFREHYIIKNLPKAVGIITVSTSQKLCWQRKAIRRSKLDKKSLLSLLWKKDLLNLANGNEDTNYDVLKNQVLKQNSTLQIQKQVLAALKDRYLPAYQMFLQDRENYTSIEDLKTITGLKKNLVV